MKIKKVIALGLIASMILGAIGCTRAPETAVSPKPVEATAEVKTDSEITEPVKITATFMQSGTYDAAAKETAEQLKANGIDVTIEAFPWATLRQNNTTDIVTGTNAYDVVSGSYYLVDLYPNYLPIQSYLDESGYASTLIDSLINKCEKYEGDIIGIPYGNDTYGLIYRTDLFEEYGIAIPKTWAEIDAAIQTLSEKLPDGIAPYAFSVGATEQLIGPFLPIYNGYYINSEGKFQLENDKAVAVIENLAQRYAKGPEGMNAMSIDQMNALFLQGNAAIIEGWPSFITGIVNDPTQSKIVGKWGIIPYPQDNGGCAWLSLWNMFINKNSKSVDAAWEFASTYTSVENATEQFVKYGIGSCHKESYSDPAVVAKYGKAFLDGQALNIAFAKNPPLSGEANDYFNQTLGDVFAGTISAQDAVTRINDFWAGLEVPASTLAQAQADGFVQ